MEDIFLYISVAFGLSVLLFETIQTNCLHHLLQLVNLIVFHDILFVATYRFFIYKVPPMLSRSALLLLFLVFCYDKIVL